MVQIVRETEGAPDLQWIEDVAVWMDSAFRIPGTRFRFGLDPIIGLVPYLGSLVTFGVSSVLVAYMSRYGVSNVVIARMIVNILIDFLIGSIPVIGDIFDFGWKANLRNIRLLKEHYGESKHMGSGMEVVKKVAIILALIFLVLVTGFFVLVAGLVALLF